MNGHILNGTNIAVDYWKIKGRRENTIHFLTHLHGDHIVGLTSSWQRPIYCSEFTSELLIKKYGLSESLLRVCPLEQTILVTEPSSRSFSVTAYDADHCPGAVMFYFQGDFGNIFYTGDFRSSSQMIEDCRHLINKIDVLYLDNTFCSPNCDFPSRDECFMSIVDIVRRHPRHDVVIGVRKLGKELLLAKLGAVLNETICVSPTCYQISQLLFTTDVFTTVALNNGKSRVQTAPTHLITCRFVENLNTARETIAIIPSAIFTGLGCQPFCRDPNIFVVPYSDHCNFPELFEFVSTLKPAKVLPIVRHFRGPFGISLSDREDMSCFQSILSKGRPYRNEQSSDENRNLSLNHISEHENYELGSLGKIVYSNLTSSSPLEISSSLQQFSHRQTRRKHRRHVPHHLRRVTRGVVYVTENSGICVNPVSDNSAICVSPVSDNSGICVNPVSDNSGICVSPVSDNSGICVSPVSDNSEICVSPVSYISAICMNHVSDVSAICVNPVSDITSICLNPDSNVSAVCVNPVSNISAVCVNPVLDVSAVCVNTLTDIGAVCMNALSDIKSPDCSETINGTTEKCYRGIINRKDKNTVPGYKHKMDYKVDNCADNKCLKCQDLSEACDGEVKQPTNISLECGGSLFEQSVDDYNNRVKATHRMLSDQSILEAGGNISTDKHPCRALITMFKPYDLRGYSGILPLRQRLDKPQNDGIKLTKDLIAALQKFVRKPS